jgi:hypothetical protein
MGLKYKTNMTQMYALLAQKPAVLAIFFLFCGGRSVAMGYASMAVLGIDAVRMRRGP